MRASTADLEKVITVQLTSLSKNLQKLPSVWPRGCRMIVECQADWGLCRWLSAGRWLDRTAQQSDPSAIIDHGSHGAQKVVKHRSANLARCNLTRTAGAGSVPPAAGPAPGP
jgi:hypothetical protein